MKARREARFDNQVDPDPGRLVLLDECATNTRMARLHGRSRRGQRCRAPIPHGHWPHGHWPHGHWKTTTLVAALTLDGIVAPMVLDGAIDGEMFKAHVEQILAPTLRPGDIVIWDTLPAHRVGGVADVIDEAGARPMKLPPCSPDFNPIEKAFLQIRASLKKTAARTKETLDHAIAAAIDLVEPQHARNHLASCGYEADTV